MKNELNEKDLSSCEKMIMKIVWDFGRDISIQEIIELLHSRYDKAYARTTVVTFIQRLAEKGFVSSYRKGRTAYVHAIKDEQQYKVNFLNNIQKFWFMGDSSNLLATLYENKKPTEEELTRLRKLIDELDC